jgi:hypothetical protein
MARILLSINCSPYDNPWRQTIHALHYLGQQDLGMDGKILAFGWCVAVLPGSAQDNEGWKALRMPNLFRMMIKDLVLRKAAKACHDACKHM